MVILSTTVLQGNDYLLGFDNNSAIHLWDIRRIVGREYGSEQVYGTPTQAVIPFRQIILMTHVDVSVKHSNINYWWQLSLCDLTTRISVVSDSLAHSQIDFVEFSTCTSNNKLGIAGLGQPTHHMAVTLNLKVIWSYAGYSHCKLFLLQVVDANCPTGKSQSNGCEQLLPIMFGGGVIRNKKLQKGSLIQVGRDD